MNQDADVDRALRATPAARRLTDRQPLADDVHDALADMMMNHALEPGARITIDSLARSLGVSPTPVREALARMEAESLVTKEPRRGYTVAPLIGLDDLRSLTAFRLLIEPAAAAAAARLAAPADREALVALASSGGSGTGGSGTGGSGTGGGAANRLDMESDAMFHDTVARLGGNPWLRDALGRLRAHLHMYRLYHHAQQAAATAPEHTAIARAIADGDSAAAEEAMRRHLTTAMRRIEDAFAAPRRPRPGA